MDLIPIHANPERDWCKRTKPKAVSLPPVRGSLPAAAGFRQVPRSVHLSGSGRKRVGS
jgi:hypothetical protein